MIVTYAGSLVGQRQRLPALAGRPAQRARAGVRAAVRGAHGRARHAARAAPHAVRAQLRVQHTALIAAATYAFAATDWKFNCYYCYG